MFDNFIMVTDNLPEDFKRVTVIYCEFYNSKTINRTCTAYYQHKKWWITKAEEVKNVFAWKELEKAPKKVYICSPYSGDVEQNTKLAQIWCKNVIMNGFIPIAPHLYFTQFLDDSVKEERMLGLNYGENLLLECSELWICGDRISEGMQGEIDFAKANNIVVINRMKQPSKRYFIYGGHKFTPVGQLTNEHKDYIRYCESDRSLGICNYNVSWKKTNWSYDDFYDESKELCGDVEYDIFLCLDNGEYYISGEHELFKYNGKFHTVH